MTLKYVLNICWQMWVSLAQSKPQANCCYQHLIGPGCGSNKADLKTNRCSTERSRDINFNLSLHLQLSLTMNSEYTHLQHVNWSKGLKVFGKNENSDLQVRRPWFTGWRALIYMTKALNYKTKALIYRTKGPDLQDQKHWFTGPWMQNISNLCQN